MFECITFYRYNDTGGNADGVFSLDPVTCAVTLDKLLDFETTSSYSLSLTVNDSDPDLARSSQRVFDIAVLDVNDLAPVRIQFLSFSWYPGIVFFQFNHDCCSNFWTVRYFTTQITLI